MNTLRLKIYKPDENGVLQFDREVTSETVHLTLGLVQDVIAVVGLDTLMDAFGEGDLTQDDMIKILIPALLVVFDDIIPLLLNTFKGTTADELRNCEIADVAGCLIQIITYAFTSMSKGVKTGKKPVTTRKATKR